MVDVARSIGGQISEALAATTDLVESATVGHAIELVGTARVRFDAIVMTCSNGASAGRTTDCVDFAHSLYLRFPWVPVVLLGHPRHAERLRAEVLLTGVRELLRFPFAAADLVRAVQRVVVVDHGLSVPRTAANIAIIRRVSGFLKDHVEDVPTLGELARMATMSRSHFSRTFHAVNGMPLRNYVRDLRLKRAVALLLTSKVSVTVVAVDSGFYDLPHFDKAFQQRLGTSPQAFRRRLAHR